MAERWLLAPKKASIWLREFYFSWRVRIHPLLCVQEKKENYSPWRASISFSLSFLPFVLPSFMKEQVHFNCTSCFMLVCLYNPLVERAIIY
ncbi:hypothetical protein SEVIR_4G147501v4 [Setaria viridis]